MRPPPPPAAPAAAARAAAALEAAAAAKTRPCSSPDDAEGPPPPPPAILDLLVVPSPPAESLCGSLALPGVPGVPPLSSTSSCDEEEVTSSSSRSRSSSSSALPPRSLAPPVLPPAALAAALATLDFSLAASLARPLRSALQCPNDATFMHATIEHSTSTNPGTGLDSEGPRTHTTQQGTTKAAAAASAWPSAAQAASRLRAQDAVASISCLRSMLVPMRQRQP